MSGLGQEFEDVLSDSSTDLENDVPVEGSDDAADLSPDEGGEDGAEGADPKKGRNIDNVYRELRRRQEDGFSRLNQAVEALRSELRTSPQPRNAASQTLDDMSLPELRAARASVPDDKKQAFDEYVQERSIKEVIRNEMSGEFSKQRETDIRRDAARKAQQRFPDLRDKTSRFYQRVEARMNERGPQYKRDNPHAVLDVAREVAEEMGVTSRQRSKPEQLGNRHSSDRGNPPKVDNDSSALMPTLDEVKRIARRTNPHKKYTEADYERLRKRVAEYRENQGHLSQRIRVTRTKD